MDLPGLGKPAAFEGKVQRPDGSTDTGARSREDVGRGHVLVSLTNNKGKNDHHGSILKVEETDGKFDALTFQASTYLAGGEANGFSCPDNLAFDLAGNLWITSDMSGSAMNKEDGPYMPFKNNSLFVVLFSPDV